MMATEDRKDGMASKKTADELLAAMEEEQRGVEEQLRQQQRQVREKYKEQLNGRLAELQPAVDEYNRVQAALHDLDGRSVKQRTSRSSSNGGSGRRPSRREREFAQVLKENPGIEIRPAAHLMGLKPKSTYLYRVRDAMLKKGAIRKRGNGFVLVDESYLVNDGE